ncbi:MAG: translesion DNA synthesis-associated protein ImuA [Pseudomonadota bacterium]
MGDQVMGEQIVRIGSNSGDTSGSISGDTENTEADSSHGNQATASVSNLLDHPGLWRAGELQETRGAKETPETTQSGFDVLDRHLPGGGWPQAGLCEFMIPSAGMGELRLLLPALKALSQQARWIAWVNPPFIPYAPALKAAGVDIDKILLIHPKTHKDALWALERATRSGTCSAALAWLDDGQLKNKDTQRLQVAARQGGTLSCLIRPEKARHDSSMAELRLAVRPSTAIGTGAMPGAIDASTNQSRTAADQNDALTVSILKRRGGWPIEALEVPLRSGRRPAEIREQLSLWRQWRRAEVSSVREPLEQLPPFGHRPATPESHITH